MIHALNSSSYISTSPMPILAPQDQKVNTSLESEWTGKAWKKVSEGSELASLASLVEKASENVFLPSGALSKLGIFSNVVGFINGAFDIKNHLGDLSYAKKISDREGALLASSKLGASTALMASSSFCLSAFMTQTASSALDVATALSGVGNCLMGIGSIPGLFISSLRLKQLIGMRTTLNQLENRPALTAVEKTRRVLEGLKQMLAISREEMVEIASDIEKNHTDSSEQEKKDFFDLKCAEKAEAKMHALKRRSSLKAVQLIVSQADDLLEKLNRTETVSEAVEKTAQIVDTIRKANSKKIAFYILGWIAAALGLAAFIVGSVASCGILPLILLLIAGLIPILSSLINWTYSKLIA